MSAYAVSARGLVSRRIPQGVLAPMNALLFGFGEQGVLYDPSDLSTLFQDAAGTTPVTAMEQPVGRMLDLSGNGNHASQATTTKRGVVSRRVNLFTESEFRNGLSDAPTRAGLVSISSLGGYLGAFAVGYDGSTTSIVYKTNYSVPANIIHRISAVIKMDDGGAPILTGAFNGNSRDFVLTIGGFAAVTNEVVVDIGNGCYRVSAERSVTVANADCGVAKYSTHSSRTFKVTAFDIRRLIDAHLPYQRVNTATDYDADPNKFPTYIRFDGVDDTYQTNSIDFTGTDKMTVWAGNTRLRLSGNGLIAELSTNSTATNGTWRISDFLANGNLGSAQSFGSRGTILALINAAPIGGPAHAVLTGAADIGAGTIAASGVMSSPVVADQGTGNYGNHPLYIGSRAGTSIFFDGRLYSLIIRGAQSSLSQIEATELYIKQKMRML